MALGYVTCMGKNVFRVITMWIYIYIYIYIYASSRKYRLFCFLLFLIVFVYSCLVFICYFVSLFIFEEGGFFLLCFGDFVGGFVVVLVFIVDVVFSCGFFVCLVFVVVVVVDFFFRIGFESPPLICKYVIEIF